MAVSVALFTPDLRVHDDPVLRAAVREANAVVAERLSADCWVGARHFLDLLVDGDPANNRLNRQWMTGTDTRPNRLPNPLVQGKRFDPHGTCVRRRVPELAEPADGEIHEPWKLTGRAGPGRDRLPGPARRPGGGTGPVRKGARPGPTRIRSGEGPIRPAPGDESRS